jgi:pSer/pThr/pTyr-binding forkhead associated (FHA) protein
VRASDRSRDRTSAALARAAGDGFLSLDTMSLRVDAALAARDVDDLDALVSDLPWYRQPPASVLRAIWRWLTEPAQPAARLVVPAESQMFVIGRSSDCDLSLDDRAISRHHARLRRTIEGWDVLDLGSTNGTWLNGRRITSAVALPGDELELADRRFVLP